MCRRRNKGVGAWHHSLFQLKFLCFHRLFRTVSLAALGHYFCSTSMDSSTEPRLLNAFVHIFFHLDVSLLSNDCPHFLQPSWPHGNLPCADAVQFTSGLPSGLGQLGSLENIRCVYWGNFTSRLLPVGRTDKCTWLVSLHSPVTLSRQGAWRLPNTVMCQGMQHIMSVSCHENAILVGCSTALKLFLTP